MAHLGDGLVDLMAGQLAAFAGLGALGDLDLHHVRIDEIFGADAKAARRDLLDRRAHGIAVRQRLVAVRFLAAFAGVRLAADPVHGDGERGVGLARDRAIGHGAGREPLDDVLGRFDLLDRDRFAAVVFRRFDAEQAADGQMVRRLVVDDPGEMPVFLDGIAAYRVLQGGDRCGVPDVIFAAHPERILAADVEHGAVDRRVAESVAMTADALLGDFVEADALDTGRRAGEVPARRNRTSARPRRKSARRNRTDRWRCPSSTSP